MAAWGYECYLLVLKVSLTRSRLEDKIRIPTRPCNILYIYDWRLYYSYKWKLKLKAFLVVLQNVTLFQEQI